MPAHKHSGCEVLTGNSVCPYREINIHFTDTTNEPTLKCTHMRVNIFVYIRYIVTNKVIRLRMKYIAG